MAVGAVGRGDDVFARESRAHARGDGLLPDRDMQEAGELAGAEPLLDLLLEAPDEQHLPEEAAQPSFDTRPPPAPAFSSTVVTEPAIMLIRLRSRPTFERAVPESDRE